MDIRRLKNFLTVVDLGSISKAADVLHIAQPALSAQIQRLEDSAGCQLLSRSSRGVAPTQAGLEFCRRATAALKQLESLRTLGHDLSAAPSGHVVVGMPASVGAMISAPLVKLSRERFPDISLGIEESASVQLGELLLRGKLDVAVLFSDNITKGVQASMLVDEDLYAAGIAGRKGSIELRALASQPIVMPARPNSLRAVLDAACMREQIQLKVVAEVSSPHTMLQLARAGLGAAVLPWSTLAGLQDLGLPCALIVKPRLTRSLAVAVATDAPLSPALIAVRSLLVHVMTELVTSGLWQGARCRTDSLEAPS